MLKHILAGVVLSLMLTGAAAAGPFEDGSAAYKRGDYATALRLWRPLAEQGIAKAQFNLGVMYRNGQGVTQDYAEALRWYRKAAGQGNTKAQHNLGTMYNKGHGVRKDYVAAMKWYRKAADQGHASARGNLGVMYSKGQGVPRDYVQAHMWFNLAVASGNKNVRKYRDRIAEKMTREQIDEAQRLEREWKPNGTSGVVVY